MSTISLRIPESLHQHLRELAKKEGTSINQLITTAVAEKISALSTEDYLAERAGRASRAEFEQALSRVADSEPEPYDKL
jgi:hypothetical protein